MATETDPPTPSPPSLTLSLRPSSIQLERDLYSAYHIPPPSSIQLERAEAREKEQNKALTLTHTLSDTGYPYLHKPYLHKALTLTHTLSDTGYPYRDPAV